MKINVFPDKNATGLAAAKLAGETLRGALAAKSRVAFIVATGASQFEFLSYLTKEPGIDWGRTDMFHLDEYLGVSDQHPASFRKYLRERFASVVKPGSVTWIGGETANPEAERRRLGDLISKVSIEVCFCGIGENGHLAFNDPPADFDTKEPYLVVNLDEACRRQQLGEGWFPTLEAVPKQAVSMSVAQIMKSKRIICTVPDARKAQAVKDCLEGPVTNRHPASILQKHGDTQVFLDGPAASLLSKKG